MERLQAIILATLIAVAVVVGIRFASDDEDGAETARSDRRDSSFDDDQPFASGRDRDGVRGSRSGGASGSSRGFGGSKEGFGGGRDTSGGFGSRGGSAETVSGGGSSRLAALGNGGGSRSDRGSVNISGSVSKVGSSTVGDSSKKSTVLDTIAAAPKEQPKTGGTLDPLDPEAEVVLTVTKKEDTEQASEVSNVEEDENTGDALKFTDDTVLTFPEAGNATGDRGTISVDITPEWEGSANTNHSLAQIQNENQWDNRIELVKNGRFLRFIIADDTGKEVDISYPLDAWEAGGEHNVTATWGDGQTQLIIDGQVVGENKYPGKINIPSGVPLRVGSKFGNYSGANSTFRNWSLSRTKYGTGS